jgi:hypothetical protein
MSDGTGLPLHTEPSAPLGDGDGDGDRVGDGGEPGESVAHRVEDAVLEAAHEVEAGVEKAWHDATTPNRCPICDGDRVPCPNPACPDLGADCPDCHGRQVLCENCDADAWARYRAAIVEQSTLATRVVSAEDNIVGMI